MRIEAEREVLSGDRRQVERLQTQSQGNQSCISDRVLASFEYAILAI